MKNIKNFSRTVCRKQEKSFQRFRLAVPATAIPVTPNTVRSAVARKISRDRFDIGNYHYSNRMIFFLSVELNRRYLQQMCIEDVSGGVTTL